ncbi:30S ribosomal protein S17 [archaeon]|nr:30S ribosomal protein S17 [archaeon]
MKAKTKNIGLGIKAPKASCNSVTCPFHGNLKIRGRLFKGDLIKKDISNTAIMSFSYYNYLRKYERYEKKRTRIKVHNPTCIDANIGDKVLIGETRPISKNKNFVILEIIK